MKLFDLDSPLIQFLGVLADLMLLNVLAIICCIPIFTVGASLTALNYMALKIVRDEECYIIKGFFKAFKDNFKQGTIIWLIFLAAILIVAGDYYIILNSGINFHIVLKVIIIIITVFLIFAGMFVFPVLSKFDNTIMRTIKNALILSIWQFPKTILMIIFYLIPPVAAAFFPRIMPIALIYWFSGPAFFSALLYNKTFQKLEDRVMEEQAAEEIGEDDGEDDRIFKDELDEALIREQDISKE